MKTEKEMFLDAWEREYSTTLKVLKAYPPEKQDMKPSEKSKSAKELAWVFPSEENGAFIGAMNGKIDWEKMEKAPKTFNQAVERYEKDHQDVVRKFKAAADSELNMDMDFMVAPKKVAKLRRMDVLWGMLMDQIHHRGQFSVYLRLAGAKVPSIYGPTADEPWM
jgi:uncharacterized damage-inducible protein DinB